MADQDISYKVLGLHNDPKYSLQCLIVIKPPNQKTGRLIVRGYDNLINFIKLENKEDKENKKYYEYLIGHFKAYGFIPVIYAEKELSIEETEG